MLRDEVRELKTENGNCTDLSCTDWLILWSLTEYVIGDWSVTTDWLSVCAEGLRKTLAQKNDTILQKTEIFYELQQLWCCVPPWKQKEATAVAEKKAAAKAAAAEKEATAKAAEEKAAEEKAAEKEAADAVLEWKELDNQQKRQVARSAQAAAVEEPFEKKQKTMHALLVEEEIDELFGWW